MDSHVLLVVVVVLVALTASVSARVPITPPYPLSLVNPIIGTGAAGWAIGHNNPGAQYPFAAMRLGPDTSQDGLYIRVNHFGGYYYRDSHIRCFSHTHVVGAGVPDFGNIGVTAVPVAQPTTDLITDHGYRSEFRHETEEIYPGYYSVYLDTHRVQVELTTAGTHAGLHRYTFASGDPRTLLVDVCHTVTPDGACPFGTFSMNVSSDGLGVEITGQMLNRGSYTSRNGRGVDVYFGMRVRSGDGQPVRQYGAWQDGVVIPSVLSATSSAGSVGAYVNFDAGEGAILVDVGISFVSQDRAWNNLNVQAAGQSFDAVLEQTFDLWAKRLNILELTGAMVEDDAVQLYTALYRTYMSPTEYTEADGSYLGFDNVVHESFAQGEHYYSDLSIWDTFRTQNPWLTFAVPEVANDVVNSLLQVYLDGGDLPRWPMANVYTGGMFGDHRNSIIVDAYVKGVRDFNATLAYEAMWGSAMEPREHDGRHAIEDYIELGFIPSDQSDVSTCLTLAYAYDDYILSIMADALGLSDDRDMFASRGKNYQYVWSDRDQFMCPANRDGKVTCSLFTDLPGSPDYKEGNAWHYTWYVMHDPQGLIDLFGGVDPFVSKLTDCFQLGTEVGPLFTSYILPNPYYWGGNEHDLHHVWMFNDAGRPDLAQKWSRWILSETYHNAAAGLPGNDDYGTLSAWYLWASIGLFPNPGFTFYYVGSPNVNDATVHLPGGDLRIVAHNNSATSVYVSEVLLDGEPLASPFVQHSDVASGATLEFFMSESAQDALGAFTSFHRPSIKF